MDLYILGIGGTFMGHLALLARQLGFSVSGCDANVYSPMREILQANDIHYDEGFDVAHLSDTHQLYVIGNAISRGNPMIEAILNQRRRMTSGPAWLGEHVLQSKWVVAVAGTHGKTTTTSMVAWILKSTGYNPGYLIGGAAKGFEHAADLGSSDYFVIEADEYDTAFFDKRSKFIHYRPRTLILNNLEFDHADIFENLEAIKKTMHHLVRTVPSQGQIIVPRDDAALKAVLDMGCWSERMDIVIDQSGSAPTQINRDTLVVQAVDPEGSKLRFVWGEQEATCGWGLIGSYNVANGAAAVAAALHVGVGLEEAVAALASFPGVARRMDHRFSFEGIEVYDDFAHHPTAIRLSLSGLRSKVGGERVVAFVEPRSNTMSMGVHQHALIKALQPADEVHFLKHSRLGFDLEALCQNQPGFFVHNDAASMLAFALNQHREHQGKAHWLCMSNGDFGGFFELIQAKLAR